LNTVDGGFDYFEFEPEEWEFDSALPRADIAVIPLPVTERHAVTPVPVMAFATDEVLAQRDIRSGEDVFMVGRFVDFDAGDNTAALRFGNISVMPVIVPHRQWRESAPSYMLDMHSRGGYSGSPVFAYRTSSSDFARYAQMGLGKGTPIPSQAFVYFLGIHWGQFEENLKLQRTSHPLSHEETLPPANEKGEYVKGLSGMTLAHTASQLLQVLNMPKLKKDRAESDREIDSTARNYPLEESAESPSPDGAEEKFRSTLGAMLKKPPNPKGSGS